MSNPNTRVSGMITLLIISSNRNYGNIANSASTAGKFKAVYVGENQYPISIIQLSETSEIAWKKRSGFGLLTSSVGSLSGGHIVSDLIMLVYN